MGFEFLDDAEGMLSLLLKALCVWKWRASKGSDQQKKKSSCEKAQRTQGVSFETRADHVEIERRSRSSCKPVTVDSTG